MVLGVTGLQGVGLLGWSIPLDTGGCRLVGKAALPPQSPRNQWPDLRDLSQLLRYVVTVLTLCLIDILDPIDSL